VFLDTKLETLPGKVAGDEGTQARIPIIIDRIKNIAAAYN